jgi:GTPase SAR1 family protein
VEQISVRLGRLDEALDTQAQKLAPASAATLQQWRADAAALQFHLASRDTAKPITVVLGGTGTGKSTLVNRLVGSTVTAASFRRTFTSGPVAVIREGDDLPRQWLGAEHLSQTLEEPPRGQSGAVVVVTNRESPTTLIDTPDLDGDQPTNHAQADRAFRWAHRIIFVVTPEKYQMTELLPYYRLALRYELTALFVMNKCEEPAVLDDFLKQLNERGWPDAHVFAIPRDDAAYEPPAEENLQALRLELQTPFDVKSENGIANRVADVVTRLNDQVIAPLRDSRRQADDLFRSLKAMETPSLGVDVNPITEELRRRLQQRSVLYLVGPGRVIDRVRQMPTLLARLPRVTWDWVMRGHIPADLNSPNGPAAAEQPPDFVATLSEQFTVVRSRIDDVLRSNPVAARWIENDPDAYQQAMIDPATAGLIAHTEIQQLRDWLEKKWNATPRDTRMLQALMKYLPGGKKLTQLAEAAPYLLTIALIVHHALFWHIDLPVLGGYTLLTWLTERISNEVSIRTRATNRKMDQRFERLAHDQIQRVREWMDRQAPTLPEIEELEALVNKLAEEGSN